MFREMTRPLQLFEQQLESLLEIRPSKIAGFGMFAKRNISEGDALLQEHL